MKRQLYKKLSAAVIALASVVAVFLCSCSASCRLYSSTLDWAVAMIEEYYYYDVSEEDVRAAGLENLNGNVLDAYSTYYTAEEYEAVQASNEGSRSGIGVSYTYISEEYQNLLGGSGVYIVSVLGNSPAQKSGLKAGVFVESAIAQDGGRTYFSSSSDFSSFISGMEEGEQFTLVTDKGEFTMAKEEYTMSYCYMATSSTEWNISYSSSGTMTIERSDCSDYSCLPEGTAYISLSQFYGNAADEMAELISIFNEEGCTSLIFDLRNNGGGLVSVMQKISWLFLADLQTSYSVAMYADYKDGSRTSYAVNDFTDDTSCFLPEGTPVTVLANNSTASASEALIGVLVSNGVADYSDIYVSDLSDEYLAAAGMQEKNCRTYGKGIMQSTYTYIFTGEALKLTVAKIYWPDGQTSIHDVGVGADDGCNTVEAEWTATYGDLELQRVVQMLQT